MEPLSGNAEHISARTAAVISTKTIVIRYEDLKDDEMLDSFYRHQFYHIAAGPPAIKPRK
jgi:hypothetical protein